MINISEQNKKLMKDAVDKILNERYFIKKDNGEMETWEDLCERVGTTLEAQKPFNEKYTRKDLIKAITNKEVMFGSPTLMNAGARLGMLSSCFIFGIKDDLEDIFEVVKASGKTFKHGGGIGYDFSSLRPEGAHIETTGGTSSGPMSFMEIIDTVGGVVKGGGLRKAAIMATMRVDHPDIEKFINIKRIEHKLNNMNLSVTATDEFMKAVANDSMFDLRFDNEVYKTMRARELMDQIVDASWRSAEPGIIFIDRVNEYNTTPEYGPITHPNPCSEFFQVHWNSCNLGSINLVSCYNEENKTFDYDKLRYLTRLVTTALNKTIEVNKFPTQKINDVTKALRPIGIGIFGVANLFIKFGYRYGDVKSLKLLAEILDIINLESLDLSSDYAKELGVFDTFDYANFKYLHERETIDHWKPVIAKIKKQGLYNCLTTTFMPTGTVSILADQGESNGIEPLFSMKTRRKFVNKQGNLEEFEVFAPVIQEWVDAHPNEKLPEYMITKDDLTPLDHIRVLAASQKHCQTGVSKTVNFPHTATRQDVLDAIMHAYELGCKSVSVYRDGSRSIQILSSDTEIEEILVSEKYHSKEIPGKNVLFAIKRQKNGKINGILPKDESGGLITVGNEAAKCSLINRLIEHNVPMEQILSDLAESAEWNGDLSTALYNILKKAATDSEELSDVFVKSYETSPAFQACPTGVCSI